MPALASSPARARMVTFMPPESPTPGGASGEECTDRTATRRTGRSNPPTTRPPRSVRLRDRREAPAGRARGCFHATGVKRLLVADLGGGVAGRLGVGLGGAAHGGSGRLRRGARGRGAAADPGGGRLGAGHRGPGRVGRLPGRPRAADTGHQRLATADELVV